MPLFPFVSHKHIMNEPRNYLKFFYQKNHNQHVKSTLGTKTHFPTAHRYKKRGHFKTQWILSQSEYLSSSVRRWKRKQSCTGGLLITTRTATITEIVLFYHCTIVQPYVLLWAEQKLSQVCNWNKRAPLNETAPQFSTVRHNCLVPHQPRLPRRRPQKRPRRK